MNEGVEEVCELSKANSPQAGNYFSIRPQAGDELKNSYKKAQSTRVFTATAVQLPYHSSRFSRHNIAA